MVNGNKKKLHAMLERWAESHGIDLVKASGEKVANLLMADFGVMQSITLIDEVVEIANKKKTDASAGL